MTNEFERVNNSYPITPELDFDVDEYPKLVYFVPFYQQLSLILSKKPTQDSTLLTSSETPPVRTTLPSTDSHMTSFRAVNPLNPRYSSGSITTSSSREFKHEHFTHTCANEFVSGSWQSLKKALENLSWYRGTNYRLRHMYLMSTIYGLFL